MAGQKLIWVLPEIDNHDEEISKLSLGLMSEAKYIAEKVGGTVTALLFGDGSPDFSDILGRYGVANIYVYRDTTLKYFSAEAYSSALLPRVMEGRPWLFLMGHTVIGRELAPRLAVFLKTGLVSNCAKMELSDPDNPKFYRSVYNDQLYQEVIFQTANTFLVTVDPRVLNNTPAARPVKVKTQVIEPNLPAESIRLKHMEFLPADFKTVDISEADTIISAGMGAATDELLPLVEELAGLVEGSIGTTRPVIDSGKIPRERMIGQTGKVVGPDFYMALGISGASHHVGGIQDSGKIVSVNRDPQAQIFRNSDVGITADLADVLPILIERIRQAKNNGEIL